MKVTAVSYMGIGVIRIPKVARMLTTKTSRTELSSNQRLGAENQKWWCSRTR